MFMSFLVSAVIFITHTVCVSCLLLFSSLNILFPFCWLVGSQTCVLKVNIHCDGCEKKVKKILHKIDGNGQAFF